MHLGLEVVDFFQSLFEEIFGLQQNLQVVGWHAF